MQGSQADAGVKIDPRELLDKMNTDLDKYFNREVNNEDEDDKSVVMMPEGEPEGEAKDEAGDGNGEGVMKDVRLSPIANRQEEMVEEGEPVLQQLSDCIQPQEVKEDEKAAAEEAPPE